MHYVILRDDDTCALTPVECVETLYRPFLDRGLPVNLAVIPNVSTAARRPNGQREGFLQFGTGGSTPYIPIGQIHALENPGRIPLEMIEVQSGSYLGEDDIVRFEDKYGRV